MSSFILDNNLSLETAAFLRSTLGLDAQHVRDRDMSMSTDQEIAELAIAEGLVIITLDLHFGRIWHRPKAGLFGVIQLRLNEQGVESVNATLQRTLGNMEPFTNLGRSFIAVDERKVRRIER